MKLVRLKSSDPRYKRVARHVKSRMEAYHRYKVALAYAVYYKEAEY